MDKKTQIICLIIMIAISVYLFLMIGAENMNPLSFIFCAIPTIIGIICMM